jgi:regulator of sigma E protease
LEENLTFVWNIAKTAIGIGFVVFVHELGHFLLAKWNGVRVDRFSIGFGRTLISYRRGVGVRVGTGSRPPGPDDPPTYGETEYVLALLPLGGYVRMLGESLEDQSEKVEKSDDPRSFNQKSVFARMQIITAGVIMNLIFGVCCFSIVYTQGWTDADAKIGIVIPGSPAYKAGLRTGDEILAIDGRHDVGFSDLKQKVALSSTGQKIDFTIKRGIQAEQTLAIEPVREPDNQMPTIGVLPTFSLELQSKFPFDSLPGQKADPARPNGGFEGDDKIVAVGPENGPLEPVKDYQEFHRWLDRLKAQPIVVEVERTKTNKDKVKEKSKVKVLVPVHKFLDFGFRLTPGPIAAIRHDSPAEKAGFKEGDRIIAVDGNKDYDPMLLPEMARDSAGKPMFFTVERTVDSKTKQKLDLTVTPDDSPAWSFSLGNSSPLDIPGLGLALSIDPKIQAVSKDSAASKAGLKPGNVLKSIIIAEKKRDKQKSDPKPLTIELDSKSSGWTAAYNLLQQVETRSIKLTIEKSDNPITITPQIDDQRFHPLRGLHLVFLEKEYPPQGLTESIHRGFDETVQTVFNIGATFRSLFQRRIGASSFSGILSISQIAYDHASAGWIPLIKFLGVLSVNLAVLNFLPIPPLDGGQFLFLTAEKVRGKPLPTWMLDTFMIVGVSIVLLLIVLVNGKDVWYLVKSYF